MDAGLVRFLLRAQFAGLLVNPLTNNVIWD